MWGIVMHNLQYKRTHKNIVDAFLRLIDQKELEEITVQQILDEAMVHRSTFYQHFKDKYEIGEQLQAYYIEELKRKLDMIELNHTKSLEEVYEFAKAYFISNRKIMKSLIKIKSDNINIVSEWKEVFLKRYLKNISESDSKNVEAIIFAAICVEFMLYYIENDDIHPHKIKFSDTFLNITKNIFGLANDNSVESVVNLQDKLN